MLIDFHVHAFAEKIAAAFKEVGATCEIK